MSDADKPTLWDPISRSIRRYPASDSPTILNIYPSPGNSIKLHDYFRFDIVGRPGQFTAFIVCFKLNDGALEVAHDGTTFRPPYERGSMRLPIQNGFHYDIKRSAGWHATQMLFKVYSIDRFGNVIQ